MVAFFSGNLRVGWLISGLVLAAFSVPCHPQSDRMILLESAGTWHLRSRIPLGEYELALEPAHRTVEILATAEAPAFAGWTLKSRASRAVLLDEAGNLVRKLPNSITFRVTASTRDRLLDTDPIRFDCKQSVSDFLAGLRFSLQIFRGMEMRNVQPTRQWMIGVPADEPADERIYRVSFDLGDARPDDRIVLMVMDASGTRVTKFHLEFL
jgi:hypothetical protein